MTRALLLPALLLVSLLAACTTGKPDHITPVDNFDANRYLGKWYEIARLDHSFERGLSDVTAEYSMRDDGAGHLLGVVDLRLNRLESLRQRQKRRLQRVDFGDDLA